MDEKWLYNNVDDDPRIGLTRHHKADIADISRQAVARLNDREQQLDKRMEEERMASRSEGKGRKKKKKSYGAPSWVLLAFRI